MSGPFPHAREKHDHQRQQRREADRRLASETISEKIESETALMRDFRVCFGTPEGQRVYTYILENLCNVDKPIIAPQVTSQEALIHRCALFDLGREIERLTVEKLKKQEKPEVKTNAGNGHKRGH